MLPCRLADYQTYQTADLLNDNLLTSHHLPTGSSATELSEIYCSALSTLLVNHHKVILSKMLPHNILSAQLTTASFIYIFIFYTTQTIVYGFNLDLYKPTIYSGPSDSDFGYSVALTISDFRGSQVLIGAPRANTTTLLNNNVLNGGAVYRCPIGKHNTLSLL